VTGATNVAVGDKVPIALAGATVYARGGAQNGEPQTKRIERSTLRGVESNGMMCSPDELLLPGEYEDGILIMESSAPVGQDFWRVARFGDAVLDVEVPSNRPDGLSIIGLAREAAAGLHASFALPALDRFEGTSPSPIGVEIGDASVCRRLLGQTFFGVDNGRSPMWMALRLAAAGVRSLSLLVDISNFVQLETAQPLHFYDASKLRGGKIVAREAHAGERVVTLDGVERELTAGMPVIADGEGPVGIAGIMGGATSAVGAQTRDVFLESPNFVGAPIRRASIALGLRTEGALRHEKDLPLELPEVGRRLAARLLTEAGGTPSAVVAAGQAPGPLRHVRARTERANTLLGASFTIAQMKDALRAVELEPAGDTVLDVTVPYWRPDVTEEVDIIEEIARGIGYDSIPSVPAVAAPQAIDEGLYDQETTLARRLAALGYDEIATLTLQGQRTLAAWTRSGLEFWSDIVELQNPLSEDHRFLRPSLLPGLLATAERWWPRPSGALRLFEVGHIFRAATQTAHEGEAMHNPHGGVYTENGVREWPSAAGLAVFADAEPDDTIDRRLLEVKGDAEAAIASLAGEQSVARAHPRAYFHPGAAGDLLIGDTVVAKFGRLHPKLARAYELPPLSYAFALYLENLPQYSPTRVFTPLPRFPATKRDIAVVVPAELPASDLVAGVRESGAPYVEQVQAFDEYRGRQIGEGRKSVALQITLRQADGTLTDEEANASKDAIVAALAKRFGATLRE
ncbi:MAG: phenylalanine--tRNA ligase subunit beta, partial [Candidatus Eremiobacteraeota bacterium]|nr:phenylalanine--tRNA ligase subunit beta [Candidatus Eremiobacteraeota bacterium]